MELLPGIHVISTVYGSAYLIAADTLTLIDCGSPYSGRRLLRYVERAGRLPEELRLIVLTHAHADHAGAAPWLRKRTGARVLANAAEVHKTGNGLSYVTPNVGTHAPVVRTIGRLFRAHPFPLDGFVEDGQVLPVSGGLRVIHTPGHSPGHVCYYLEKEKILFAGDLIINNGDRLSRPFPFRGMSPELVESSLQKLAGLEVNVLCCSHGRPLVDDIMPLLRRFISSPPPSYSWRRIIKYALTSPLRSRRHR